MAPSARDPASPNVAEVARLFPGLRAIMLVILVRVMVARLAFVTCYGARRADQEGVPIESHTLVEIG